jgi:hypothetical protein
MSNSLFQPLKNAALSGVTLFDSAQDWYKRTGLMAPAYPDQCPKFWTDNSAVNNPGYTPTYFDGMDGALKPGYLVVAMGGDTKPLKAGFVTEQASLDGITTSVLQIELKARPYLSRMQSDFYRKYAGHPHFRGGIPYLEPMVAQIRRCASEIMKSGDFDFGQQLVAIQTMFGTQGFSRDWAGTLNFREDIAFRPSFPVFVPDAMALRFNPDSGEIEMFDIMEYMKAFPAESAGGSLSDEDLADRATQVLFNPALTKVQKGAEIRRLAR